jgi:cation-transporting P-type ATPase 13A2
VSRETIFLRALDLITIAVPPALPATMSIGTNFAISRLRKTLIFCTSPPRVNICGKVNLIGWDKTGTLTVEGLEVLGVRFLDGEGKFGRMVRNIESIVPNYVPPRKGQNVMPASMPGNILSRSSRSSLVIKPIPPSIPSNFNSQLEHGPSIFPASSVQEDEADFPYPLILCAMATCHSIKVIQGSPMGDPLDLKMFEFTGWHIEEGQQRLIMRPYAHSSNSEIEVLKSFEFIPTLRRMSVVCRRSPEQEYFVFCKGAPEAIQNICLPETRIEY